MIPLTYTALHESDGWIKYKGSARGRHCGRHWRVSLLRRAPAPAGAWYRRRVDQQPDSAGTVSPHLHRANVAVPRSDLPPTLLRATTVCSRRRVLRPSSAQAATPDLLAGRRAAARPVGGALGRTVVLLRGKRICTDYLSSHCLRHRLLHGLGLRRRS